MRRSLFERWSGAAMVMIALLRGENAQSAANAQVCRLVTTHLVQTRARYAGASSLCAKVIESVGERGALALALLYGRSASPTNL
mmetsp:Transcript_753/g.2674  ORF Transcript_753/g.2674 Transcript_753/m.2674 type:complete len:84 (+) Transcript_753:838-1089(+)